MRERRVDWVGDAGLAAEGGLVSESYFSDRELGERPRTHETIDRNGWLGFYALIRSRIEDGSFGSEYPERCSDSNHPVCGTNRSLFEMALRAEVEEAELDDAREALPSTPAILDMLEFCHSRIAAPIQGRYHDFHGHHHLTFDVPRGRERFRSDVNRLLARQGLAYELGSDGRVTRRASEVLDNLLGQSPFDTGDAGVDQLLEDARRRFRSPEPTERKMGLEQLWDAFERIKTLEDPDKATGARLLLDRVAAGPELRAMLEAEARALTALGNQFRIRHHETDKPDISESRDVDYLFHRMYAFVWLLLSKSDRLG